ncbi:sensor histidine kinase [Dongia deserti]|uniref:sensor histidine kinase n=1 Tax=Dongia deserti TaxID=2268030 RepID=UPI000E6534D7|nr:PAS domain-containing sensor histidine kinase [Dongia deserti]
MEFGSFAIVVIAVLAPLAAVGAWHLWRGGAAFMRPERQPPQAPLSPFDPWAKLPLAIAGFDREDRLIGASHAFRDELGARNIALDDVLKPGVAAQALFDAWSQRSGGTITPITAIATLPAHELIWPANGNRAPHRLACVALHDAAGASYRLLVDPAILSAAPIIPAPESAADTRAIIARNAVLASALQSITIGVALCDATTPEATILYVNPAFGRITGYERQEVIGQPLRFLQARGTPQDQLERLERALIQRRAANLLLRSQRKDGKPFWNDMHVNPILEDGGHVAHFVAFITDASPRIRAEENLREAKHQAEIANRAKSDFLANVSHELRTPLNAIIGFSEIMKMQMFGPMGHKQYATYADDIHASGNHLLSIINDILDLSKIEAGRYQLHIEAVDLDETFEDCARLVRERAENAGLKLTRAIDPATPQLVADKRAVKQILINLLSNAIKFTPQGGAVTMTAKPAGAGWVALSVTDTGIGIPPEQLDNALSAFGQVDNPFTRSQEGTGLGLPIVKSLVELHGGQFQIESAVGKGTKITMTMPAQKLEASRQSDADAEAAHGV